MRSLAASLPVGARRSDGRILAATGLLLSLAATQPAQAQTGPSVQTFDIDSQAAPSALLHLCLQAGCELAFVQPPGREIRTRAVHGRMSWRAALDAMLQGTDLRYRFVGARGVRLWVEPRRPDVRRPAATHRAVAPVAATEVEAVEVVGRLSDQIDRALRRKRDADVISDGVSAERIGDLPSANLAEALQRVPGVAIEREVGEGQFVSVRGLGPLFQSVTLNGAPVAFNENIRNSTQSGRQFRFRALSVDLLAGARLTKSAAADLPDGGIGSNIDIQTQGGLDGAPFLTARLGAETVERRTDLGPDASLAGRWVSPGGAFGLVAGLSQEGRAVRYARFQIMRYGEQMLDGRMIAVPNDLRTTVEQEDRRRRSAFLGADWQATPGVRLDFDALASTFDNTIREDRLVFGLGERLMRPGGAVQMHEGVVVAGRVVDGRIDNNTEFSDQSHLNLAASIGAEIEHGDWRLVPRVSLSSAQSVLETPLERLSVQSPEGVGYAFDLAGAADRRQAAWLTTDFDLLDPSRLTLAQLAIRAVESRDDDMTAALDVRRLLDRGSGPLRFTGLRLGTQWGRRSRDYQRRDRRAVLRNEADGIVGLFDATVAADVFSDLVGARPGPWIVSDFARVRAAFATPDARADVVFRPGDLVATGTDLQNSYGVQERVDAAYARLDFEGSGAGLVWSGNAGLRLVRARTHVEGARMIEAQGRAEVRPVAHDSCDTRLLPSLNLAADMGDGRTLRLAASRSLTRPSLADLRASTVPASVLISAISVRGQAAVDRPEPGVIFSGVGGNPALTPYLATSLDLSYEITGRRTSFSVAVFHKTIDDFIQAEAATETLVFETRTGVAVHADVLMSRPRNVGRARIDGVEMGVHQRLAGGLGVWANATWTHSRLAGGERLTGVSDLAWSINPYLERGPLAVNLSWSWRSAFRSEADLQGGGVSAFVIGPAGYMDAQATYRIDQRTRLSIAATNLTDTRDLAYEGSAARLLQLGSAGRQFSLGLEFNW
ncbi:MULTISPECIES: TonB-dependent receptor [unclassified Brevundimonas]|uniref:TonB-dependent receptor n=1 Tax=unclassified Brevundimonas TaxID=2622653 RepID=UPI0025C4773D|nr:MULTISPECIES: TonB-dependent receptor [unclassified Brevundimonas]